MADVAASPDKLVLEGRLNFWDDWRSSGIRVGDVGRLRAEIREWVGIQHHYGMDVTTPSTYRITVERLPDAK